MSKAPHFAGFAISGWAFALRTWAAMMLALYIAFWLQLDGAASAATCVSILSLQTRGQALQKAVHRIVGTIIGLTASLLIAGLFSQTRYLFFLSACVWLGLCEIAASLFDGTRAYAAILSGYTVAIVALPNVDTPLATFSSAVNRGAAISVGIAAIAFVGDLLTAPNLFPAVLSKLEAASAKVDEFAEKSVRDGAASLTDAAALLKAITSLHPDISALTVESLAGRARYRAACLASVSLLRVVSAARVVSNILADLGPDGEVARTDLVTALSRGDFQKLRQQGMTELAHPDTPIENLVAAVASLVLAEQRERAAAALDALRLGIPVGRRLGLLIYKSRHAALRNGMRVGISWAISSFVLSMLAWPASIEAISQLGMVLGLSAVNPNPRTFAIGAVIAIPLAAAAAGITEFLILDGKDDFPLLVLGTGPAIIVACLLISTGKPALFGVGFLMLVYFPMILSPSNPQDYNPQAYLFSSFLTILAVLALFVLISTVLPTSDAMHRRWALQSARTDLRRSIFSQRHLDPIAYAFRDADRIAQLSDLSSSDDRNLELLAVTRMSDLAACARRIRAAPDTYPISRAYADQAERALAALDSARLRDLGRTMLKTFGGEERVVPVPQRRMAVDLLLAAILIERHPGIVAEIRSVRG